MLTWYNKKFNTKLDLKHKITKMRSATLITSVNKDSAMGIVFYSPLLLVLLLLLLLLFRLNPYMPNGISQYCQKDGSISDSRVVG